MGKTKDFFIFSLEQSKVKSNIVSKYFSAWYKIMSVNNSRLNYIDLFSRIQIENLILKSKPSMIVVEHDSQFRDNVATRIVEM